MDEKIHNASTTYSYNAFSGKIGDEETTIKKGHNE